ncbi:MAG: nadh-dependent butanol dehydrogenase a [Herbinix sp.]|jgi:alcohol dehydrogenase YqhD (iron-dependent ADH family)|nr:nadh-dependent butanol dehydrogenase a [Herbinix sp.]
MINFTWYNPTKIIFGKNTHNEVGNETKKYAKKVLLHYGGKSLKATGTYDAVVNSLKNEGVDFVELGGVRPNPRLSLVQEGIEICRREGIEFILAVGGGSVIDSAKAIAAGVPYEGNVWDFYSTEKQPEKMLSIGVVLTIPAAGSESSDGSVITNEEGPDKRSCCTDLMYPKFAILNPELCYTLPVNHISAGGADILAHIMERYFAPNSNTDLSDRLSEAAMKALIYNLPKVLKDNKDYDAWAEVMWTGCVAHNGLLGRGRQEDWASHGIEHELSAIYDIAHGAGLAIIFPAWMKYVNDAHPERFVQFAQRVFDVDTQGKTEDEVINEGIEKLEAFFKGLGLATTLHEAGIDDKSFEVMAQKAAGNWTLGSIKKLTAKDIVSIYKKAL